MLRLRENNYNTGLRGVLFDAEHYARMGPAVWLYGWLILRQTHQTGTIGWVLGGAPIHYREIEEETGFNRRTLERWMKVLRRQKYIETAVVDGGITVKILKAKKHLHRRMGSEAVRGTAGGVRKDAGAIPRNCVTEGSERDSYQQVASGIGSSSVVRIKEKETAGSGAPVESEENFHNIHPTANVKRRAELWEILGLPPNQGSNRQSGQNQNQNDTSASHCETPGPGDLHSHRQAAANRDNPSTRTQSHRPPQQAHERPSTQQNFSWDLRERMRWIRAERDEAVRRELAVGSGPEVRRQ